MNTSTRKFVYGLALFAGIVLGVVLSFNTDLYIFVLIILLMLVVFLYRKNMDRIDEKNKEKKDE